MPEEFKVKADLRGELMTYGSTLWRDGLPCLVAPDHIIPETPVDE